jgi:hypothetical protein
MNHIWSSPIFIIIQLFNYLLQVYILYIFSKSNYSNDVLLMFEPYAYWYTILEFEYFNYDMLSSNIL